MDLIQKVAELAELQKAATPGPWAISRQYNQVWSPGTGDYINTDDSPKDAAFIMAAGNLDFTALHAALTTPLAAAAAGVAGEAGALAQLFKDTVVNNLLSQNGDIDAPWMIIGHDSYSIRQLATEIQNGTEFGLKRLAGLIALSTDIAARNKCFPDKAEALAATPEPQPVAVGADSDFERLVADMEKLLVSRKNVIDMVRNEAEGHEGIYMSRGVAQTLLRGWDALPTLLAAARLRTLEAGAAVGAVNLEARLAQAERNHEEAWAYADFYKAHRQEGIQEPSLADLIKEGYLRPAAPQVEKGAADA